MFNQLVKWTIIIGMWRKYKRHLMASVLLLVSLVLINYIHLDFVEYSVATNSEHLGFSYAAKWLAFALAIVIYAWHIKQVNQAAKYDSKLHELMQSKTSSVRKEKDISVEEQNSQTDPFANIRKKKKLKSEADFLLDKESKEK